MVTSSNQLNPLNYLGPNAPRPSHVIVRSVVPTTSDFNEDIGTISIENQTDGVFILTSVSSAGATWIKIS